MSYEALLEEINKLLIAERLALLKDISHTLRENLDQTGNEATTLTSAQIRALPREERQKILTESARLALPDYELDGELTEFTRALAGEDIYDFTVSTEKK